MQMHVDATGQNHKHVLQGCVNSVHLLLNNVFLLFIGGVAHGLKNISCDCLKRLVCSSSC